jgi:hypothetical protein
VTTPAAERLIPSGPHPHPRFSSISSSYSSSISISSSQSRLVVSPFFGPIPFLSTGAAAAAAATVECKTAPHLMMNYSRIVIFTYLLPYPFKKSPDILLFYLIFYWSSQFLNGNSEIIYIYI